MATLTPTASSTAIAGASFWALIWLMLGHIDTILWPFRVRNKQYAQKIPLWINDHKGITFCGTELVNIGHAGLSPMGVTFALGGTVLNFFVIFFFNPIRCWRIRKKNPLFILQTPRKRVM